MMLFSRILGIAKPINKLLNICVIKEAKAAPFMPNVGIRSKFNSIFNEAPKKFIRIKYFCLFSAIIQMLLAVPKYENVVYQTTIRRVVIDAIY